MEAKHSQFLAYLKKEAKEMNLRTTHPRCEKIDYIRKADKSFKCIEFSKAYHNFLKKGGIIDQKQADNIKWKIYVVFDVPQDNREMPLVMYL